MSEHSKYEYNKYKEEYDQAVKERDELQQNILDLSEKMTQWSKEDSVFNGYMLRHQYRYVNKERVAPHSISQADSMFLFLSSCCFYAVQYRS